MTFKGSKSVQMYRISKYAARWQCCCLCGLGCHSCQAFMEISPSSMDEADLSFMQNVNNHASKMERSVPQSSREGFKLLFGGTYWDLDLDTSDIWVNLHFSTHACVWMNNVGGRPVHVCVTSNVILPGMIIKNCLQTWPCFSRKKKKITFSVSNGKK